MVKADRELRGATFNSELYKVFKNSKADCSLDPKKQKASIYDEWSMKRTRMSRFRIYVFNG